MIYKYTNLVLPYPCSILVHSLFGQDNTDFLTFMLWQFACFYSTFNKLLCLTKYEVDCASQKWIKT